jgi:hypothetical protein
VHRCHVNKSAKAPQKTSEKSGIVPLKCSTCLSNPHAWIDTATPPTVQKLEVLESAKPELQRRLSYDPAMQAGLDPFRFLLTTLAGWMNQQCRRV